MPGLCDTCECRVHRARRARGPQRPFGRRLCPDLRRKLHVDLAKGMSVSEAARRYGLHHSTIQEYVNRYWYRIDAAYAKLGPEYARNEYDYLAKSGLLPLVERIKPRPGQFGHPDFFEGRVIGVPKP